MYAYRFKGIKDNKNKKAYTAILRWKNIDETKMAIAMIFNSFDFELDKNKQIDKNTTQNATVCR